MLTDSHLLRAKQDWHCGRHYKLQLQNETRMACVQFALSKWMEDTVCSSQLDQTTKRLLNLTFM